MSDIPHRTGRAGSICRKMNAVVLSLAWLLLMAEVLEAAPETNAPATSDTVITNIAQLWVVAATSDERGRVHPARMELLVYYCNTNWSVFWGKSDDLSSFLPLKGIPMALHSGEKVLLDGWVLPVNQEFLWDKTAITVLSTSNRIETVSATGKILNVNALKDHFVETEALVDSVQTVSPEMIKLNLLADDFNVDAFVQLERNHGEVPDLTDKIVRIQGAYAASPDPFGRIVNVTLWVPGLDRVRTIGSLTQDPRFAIPVVTSEDFTASDSPALARVKGQVRRQQLGETVTIWDATGQIRILAKQRKPLQLGDRIEAIGYPTFQGMDRVLQAALFRFATNQEAGDFDTSTNAMALRLADQVRGLDQESIGQHPPASLQGLVTCVDASARFVFVQDSSGGIRVMQSRLQSGRRIQPGMLVNVTGVAATGEFAPVITNAVVRQTAAMPLPEAPLISLEEALTGTEDGHWIQMRGYVRKLSATARTLELQLVAPGGEFVARVPKDDAPQAPQGAVVLVQGVCVATANSRRQLTGIEIWSTSPGSVQTEQRPPGDLFALPRQSIASLRQFNLFNALDKRVRTHGAVTLQVPGRYLYLQDGDNSLFALSSQTEPLHLGDQVEVVGFSGNDSGNFLLREAAYRRVAAGPGVVPVEPPTLQSASEDLDGMLVRTKGMLLDIVMKSSETRLIIQVKERVFEAILEAPAGFGSDRLEVGSTVAVTGVYRIQRDESGKPVSFIVNLRQANDVQVLAPPPWLTLRRVFFIVAGALPVFLLALFWALQTRRKNQQLQRAQVELSTARDKLEERVDERTRELNEEIEARKRALLRLSEAQQRLILASRQAGMAEVATGILHNVGNILNSVNVSATVIGDSLQRLRIEKFSKAMDLLVEHRDHLTDFLTSDPRGRTLPGYLDQLAKTMVENEQTLNAEVKSLSKQIDHVKAVVAWQQDHARGSGFYESLNPLELMEDALQINQGGYEHHKIEVIREYDQVPAITTDRHKVLQILINLLGNAKQAVTAAGVTRKQVFLRIRTHGDTLRFEVSDTGVGIAHENMERVFSLGFTTKPNGHGFGLHSGANGARELGGRLFAASDGTGCGATFVLEVPIGPKSERAASALEEIESI